MHTPSWCCGVLPAVCPVLGTVHRDIGRVLTLGSAGAESSSVFFIGLLPSFDFVGPTVPAGDL